MTTREQGHITIYDDGVVIYIGITKGGDNIELEVNATCAFVLANELLEHVGMINKTIAMTTEKGR